MNRWIVLPRIISDSLCAALLAGILSGHLSAAAGEADSPIKPYYDFIYYTSVGDVERALAQFADDAAIVFGPSCSVASPCVGKAAIKERYIVPMVRGRQSLPLAERYDGRRMHARGSAPAHRLPDRQIFEFRDGRIAAVRAEG